MNIPNLLIVAGSDSCGGAGIQADIKTAIRFRCYPATIITAITAQNTKDVLSSFTCPHEMIDAQLSAVFKDMRFSSVKSGMIPDAEAAEILMGHLKTNKIKKYILDPVIRSQSGFPLIDDDAIEMIRTELAQLALLITPNKLEGEILSGISISSIEEAKEACRLIHKQGAKNVLLKGGHIDYEISGSGDISNFVSRDILFDGDKFRFFDAPRLEISDVHGTGCSFATAISAGIAKGQSLDIAIRNGKHFISEAIKNDLKVGHGAKVVNQNFRS